jgi:single-strand DNA-binding protein
VNRRYTDGDGAQQQETIWVRVTCWNRTAEIANQYLAKGRQVYVEGRLNVDPDTGGPRLWNGNDGQSRASFEITATSIQFLGSGNGANGAEAPAAEPVAEGEIPF